MNFTQEQITEILLDIANKKEGFNLIMKMSLDVLMRSERKIFQEDNLDEIIVLGLVRVFLFWGLLFGIVRSIVLEEGFVGGMGLFVFC